MHPRFVETVAHGCERLAAMPAVIGDISSVREQVNAIRALALLVQLALTVSGLPPDGGPPQIPRR